MGFAAASETAFATAFATASEGMALTNNGEIHPSMSDGKKSIQSNRLCKVIMFVVRLDCLNIP